MSASVCARRHEVPTLRKLVVREVSRTWHPARSLSGLPVELSKMIWTELKAQHAKEGMPMSCVTMYPLVRDVWRAETLDLSDAGKWITNASMQALGYIGSLRSLRLTACRFLTDDGLPALAALQLHTIDISWSLVSDAGIAVLARMPSLTSVNMTGLDRLTDRGVASLISLTGLRRLALACTGITDVALDYLTYYTRYPDAASGSRGVADLEWLELSNTRLTDTGVGKLVAVLEEGKPYGKVFKKLEYLALSMTNGVGPSAVRQVRVKYGFDTPLPNAQRTLAKSNSVALEARDWVIRFMPTKDRQLPSPTRSWEQARLVNYVAQFTKEMAAAANSAPDAHEQQKRQRVG
uniref:F-box/LRR-repeat protein 15-like leucin rich repeat domain-containing protein n=1 Tax=Coccolithus braarudii TaxID=221442 RepID=A0A6T7KQQ4_9EUKA|mmetsp:Transcript_9182/g.19953  ORF Transcript_9182/g.19953 Transcript_9182/m.19953 type:complete len:350 (+) Transcript_9182:329-1378(+)